MDRPPDGPDADQGAVLPQGTVHVFQGEASDASAEAELCGSHDLGLDAAGVPRGPDNPRPRQGLGQVVSRHAEGVDLVPGHRDCGLSVMRPHHAVDPDSPRRNRFTGVGGTALTPEAL